ncbi:MAG: ATP-binding protein [Draconibacterium sp.]
MEVIGRNREKRRLDEIMNSDRPEFVAIFGRRRIGKTFLIREYLKENIVFDFTGTFDATLEIQLQNFFQIYLQSTKGQRETIAPANWQQAFQYLANYLVGLNERAGKIVVFLDEMPWMNTPRSGFLSALEYFWNQHGSRMPKLVLIACGSASTWMQKELIEARGGLHNRVTQRIHLMPFTLAETEAFCNYKNLALTRYQIIQLYMAFGGIPFYLNELKKGKSATQIIDETCFNEQGLLYSEYNYLLASLFRNAENHLKVIEALASFPQGLTRNEILKITKLADGGTINRAIEELENSGFITRQLPFQNKKKDTIYKLFDLYCLFYLKFIKPNKPAGEGTWLTIANTPAFKAWSGYAFENICTMHIDKIKKALGISGIYSNISAWKFTGNDELPGAQIDLLIDRNDKVVNLCEAKFSDKEFIITKDYAQELRKKKLVFEQKTKTKKSVFTTLLSTYPALQNKYYLEEIQSEVTMDALFEE